ncbi:MAG: C10 family peptidase, partial [Bacteroidaceae bacterium]|nr:C10 family peptidase [Bacteroidaceae bacterium]
MKKTISLLALLLIFAVTAIAGPVEPEKALEIANSFWRSVPGLKQSELLLLPVGPSKSAGRDGVQTADAQYYLFTPEDKSGFVIVSGEDCLSPVVGYSTTACAGEMPPALVDWLADYSNFVDDVRAGIVEPIRTTATVGTRIEPMLQTSWNQSAPYNNYCPEVNGQRTPTGCTATAAAQVMKFHNWPEKPTKEISWYNNINGTTETIDITQNTYKWSDMLNHYRSGYTAEQADAVARLMVDVGKAIKSVYAISGTSSSDIQVARALVDVFDYSPDIRVYKRNECTYDEFISIIRENLEARQPLLYSGQAQSYVAGHAFVCDGIDENNLLHIDWGWDGAYNGYFDMGSMAPGGSGIGGGQDRYNVAQSIVANIRPRSADDVDRVGDPSLYYSEVLDITNNNAVVDEYTSKFISG